jgi:hypothetical protein
MCLELLSWALDGNGYVREILVGGLEHFLFFYILGISSSQLTPSFFRGVG